MRVASSIPCCFIFSLSQNFGKEKKCQELALVFVFFLIYKCSKTLKGVTRELNYPQGVFKEALGVSALCFFSILFLVKNLETNKKKPKGLTLFFF